MKKILLIVSCISLAFFGCSKDDEQANDCINFKHAFITNVSYENLVVAKNFDLPIELTFDIENTCGSFYAFDVVRNDKVYDIKINTKYEGCSCNDVMKSIQETYHFRSAESGIYTLNFYTTAVEFTTLVIVVE